MSLEEYYLTRAEAEILTDNAARLHDRFSDGGARAYELVELGAGDGAKTKLLLAAATERGPSPTYRPVDISADILNELTGDLRRRFPALRLDPIAASYEEALAGLPAASDVRRVVLFLGSNIGNFPLADAAQFCSKITAALRPGDLLLVGADLRKDPRRILRAYDDARGVTARFALNLLHRANRELGADFDLAAWGFYPLYNPETGEVRSYLWSRERQRVSIPQLGLERTFEPGEVIHVEVSRKYLPRELERLAEACGCRQVDRLTDREGLFADVLWEVT